MFTYSRYFNRTTLTYHEWRIVKQPCSLNHLVRNQLADPAKMKTKTSNCCLSLRYTFVNLRCCDKHKNCAAIPNLEVALVIYASKHARSLTGRMRVIGQSNLTTFAITRFPIIRKPQFQSNNILQYLSVAGYFEVY